MTRKINILVASSIFPNSEEVTKGIYIFHQAKALAKYCRVKAVAPVPFFPGWIKSENYGVYSRIKKRECIQGIEVLHPRVLLVPKIGRSMHGFLYAVSLFHTMKRLKHSFRPDVILGYWVYPDGFANVLMAKLLKIPVVIGGRGCDINTAADSRLKKKMVSWALQKSDRVMAVSRAMKRTMIALGATGRDIKVIPNGLDAMFISSGNTAYDGFENHLSRRDHRKTIMYCGRLSSEKGLSHLIKASNILKGKNIPFRLLIVGDGPEKAALKAHAATIGLTDSIQFKNEVPQEEIPAMMSASDIFCLPSLREGWPNVLMEAMARGVPVVASRVGGVPEIITKPEYGIMVPKADPKMLAEALETALTKTWDRSLIHAAVKDRTWDAVAVEILTEIEQVLSR